MIVKIPLSLLASAAVFLLRYRQKGKNMTVENKTKSANYLNIISVLQQLKNKGCINEKEYARAKQYYRKLTGADIVIVER